jgi:pimeloyl-ACP methyl ester carboxylesterase
MITRPTRLSSLSAYRRAAVKRVFGACIIVFLGICLEGTLVAQAIAPRVFRAVAGESRTAGLRDGVPSMTSITSTRTTPPLEFPIRVETASVTEPLTLRLVLPPATPPGDYTIEITGRDTEGRSVSTTLQMTVDPVALSRPAVMSSPPVILLNGFQLSCSDTASTLAASADTFGQLATLLLADGVDVAYFNNCAYGSDASIEQLAGQMNNYIAALKYTDGAPVDQVDLVAHSMGGLIVRAYLSGKQSSPGEFSPPESPKIRKAIFLATPHFGSYQADNPLAQILFTAGTQLNEMKPGSQFLWDLATWNQSGDDLRGVDALAVAGDAGAINSSPNASDGVVSLTSASLRFAEPDVRTRIVPYCHIQTNSASESIEASYLDCTGPGIAYIDTPSHESYEIISSFLADSGAWQAVGHSPSQDGYLDQYGGLFVAAENAQGQYLDDLTSVELNGTALSPGPSNSVTSVYYDDRLPAGSSSVAMVSQSGGNLSGSEVSGSGGYRAVLFKEGPHIFRVRSRLGTGLPGLTVASGSAITVSGVGFSAQTGTSLLANGVPLSAQVVPDKEITAILPATYSGLVSLTVSNSNGKDTVNVVVAPPGPPRGRDR